MNFSIKGNIIITIITITVVIVILYILKKQVLQTHTYIGLYYTIYT